MQVLTMDSLVNDTLINGNILFSFENRIKHSSDKVVTIIMSEDMMKIFLLVNFWGPGQCVTILGLLVNGLNVVTFLKQGVKDSVNTSLLALAISDLGSLIFLLFLNLCWTPPIMKLDLPFYPQQIMYFLFWGHVIFTRVTTGTTAWIAFERCLCIVSPLRIKSLVTPGRAVTFIVTLYVIMTAAIAPLFYTSRFTWRFDATRNKSILGYVKIANGGNFEDFVYFVNNILPITFFAIIVACTAVLVKALLRNSKWRQASTSSTDRPMTNRDMRVIKMVLIISIVFIFCYAPGAVFFIWPLMDSEMKVAGSQKHFVIAVFSLLLHLEGINASANFFIYINMSSKFRAAFKKMFCCETNEN